jgi:serine/threonine protein kinase
LLNSKDSNNIKLLWEAIESTDKYKNISDEFKNLYIKMISFNPRKRPKIDEILKDKWFGNIPNMTEEELKNYEKEIKMEEEFKNRKIEVDNKSKDEIKKNNDESNKIYIKTHPTKSIGDEKDDFFNSELICKNVESEKYMNYYINIKGNLDPRKFMNSFCNKIINEFGNDNCYIEADKNNKAKFDIIFEEDAIQKEIKEKLKNIGIEISEDTKEIKMKIKLYKTIEGYLLRFVKKEGDKDDFIEKFEKLSKLVKNIFE